MIREVGAGLSGLDEAGVWLISLSPCHHLVIMVLSG